MIEFLCSRALQSPDHTETRSALQKHVKEPGCAEQEQTNRWKEKIKKNRWMDRQKMDEKKKNEKREKNGWMKKEQWTDGR